MAFVSVHYRILSVRNLWKIVISAKRTFEWERSVWPPLPPQASSPNILPVRQPPFDFGQTLCLLIFKKQLFQKFFFCSTKNWNNNRNRMFFLHGNDTSTCNPRSCGLAKMETASLSARVALWMAISASGCSLDPLTSAKAKHKNTTNVKNFTPRVLSSISGML